MLREMNSFIFAHPDGLGGDQSGDGAVYAAEYRLADRSEHLGFDSVWSVEHHFNGYAMCPDPLNFLTYIAARTSRVKLGTMVVVAPWHHPIRVAEDVSVLDQISGGRVILGVGRGVSKTEFDGFGLDMNLSRQQLIEHTEAAMMGLERGYIEYNGEVLNQPHVLIRPMPQYSFNNRLYFSAQSAETFPIMARLGPRVRWWQLGRDDDTSFVDYPQLTTKLAAIKADYEINMGPEDADALALEQPADALILAILVVPEDPRRMTANLAGPLVINLKTLQGRQLVLNTEKYALKFVVFPNN